MRRVAILGMGEGCDLYPADREVWALAWSEMRHRAQRVFDIHHPTLWNPKHESIEKFREIDAPLYMYRVFPELPNSGAYPVNDVLWLVQEPMQSTVSYMVALAIWERVDAISLHGVHMRRGTEYAYQRANCRYLLGFARGQGIEVTLPNGGGLYDELGLYGVAA